MRLPAAVSDEKGMSFKCIRVCGCDYQVEVQEVPFREGVELRCIVDGEELRVSDTQLGLHEAMRLLEVEITQRIAKKTCI